MEHEDRLLTVPEVAKRLRVHPETIRRWLRTGSLNGFTIGARKAWRIATSEVERFIADRR